MLPGRSYRSGDPLGDPGRDSDHSLLLLSPGRSVIMSPRRPERSLSSVEPTPESLASVKINKKVRGKLKSNQDRKMVKSESLR